MKAAPLALACALLSATALVPASFAQTQPSLGEPSPSTSTATSNRADTLAQRDGREQDSRSRAPREEGGYSAGRGQQSDMDDDDDDDDDDEDDDEDDDAMMGAGDNGHMDMAHEKDDDHDHPLREGMKQRMKQGMQGGLGRGMMGQGMALDPAMLRMHLRMMAANRALGARLSLKKGDASIDIHCPAGEQIAACVEAVTKLMDRVQAMPQTR